MAAKKPTASIIIPTKDEWKMTCRCIESIRKFTKESYEVILVDNGSSRIPDSIRQQPFLHLIKNNWNRGFAAAINQGLEKAQGDYLVWLNNDTLPSHRWLTQLLHVLRTDSSIGLVGPVSNKVIPEQKIAVSLQSVDKILRFTQQFNHTDSARWKDTVRLSGFCLVYPREVLQKVGLLDERFGLGTYEDDDYCYRVRRAGYRLVVAGDTYVHHFGSTSFKKNGYNEFRKILAQNRRYYIHKWNRIPEGEG